MDSNEKEEINNVNFNQDNGCFIVSTSNGIRVFNTHEFQSTFFRDFEGGIQLAEMLFRTNIIGFVGTGNNTSYPSNRLILWDDIQHRPFGELNFKTDVLNVKLRKDRVVVVLEEKIYVYNFQNLECSDSWLTWKNPLGLVSLSTMENNCVLAFPVEKAGKVQVVLFNKEDDERKKIIQAHNTSIAMLRLSQDGSILATASQKGTLIRLFDTATEQSLCELRRGAVQAVITDISIDANNEYVSCASDQGTIHVFKVEKGENGSEHKNQKSKLSGLSGAFGYFGSKWSFSQFRVKDSYCKAAVLSGKVIAISKQGSYYCGNIAASGDIKIEKQIDLMEESRTQDQEQQQQ